MRLNLQCLAILFFFATPVANAQADQPTQDRFRNGGGDGSLFPEYSVVAGEEHETKSQQDITKTNQGIAVAESDRGENTNSLEAMYQEQPTISSAAFAKALTKAIEYLDQEQVKENNYIPTNQQWEGNWPQYLHPLPTSIFRSLKLPDVSPFMVSFIHDALVPILETKHAALLLDTSMYQMAREMRVRAAKFMKRFQSVPSDTPATEEVGTFGFWPKDPNPYWPPKLIKYFQGIGNMIKQEGSPYTTFFCDRVPINGHFIWPHFMAIPSDADDTSVIISALLDHQEIDGGKSMMDMGGDGVHDEIDFASFFADWRDTGEWQYVHDQTWRPKGSGAFVTWFNYQGSDFVVQDVDLVVNANVLHLLGRSGKQDTPGFDEAVALINLAAEQGIHRVQDPPGYRGISAPTIVDMSYYYPNNYAFQYAVSRAYGRGGVTGLKPAIQVFVDDLQKAAIREEDSDNAVFVVHWDLGNDAPIVNTAFAVLTLVNIVEAAADEADDFSSSSGSSEFWKHAVDDLIQQGAAWLVQQQTEKGDWDEDSVFFYGNSWPNLGAEWFSRSWTTAMSLEAIARSMIRASTVAGTSSQQTSSTTTTDGSM